MKECIDGKFREKGEVEESESEGSREEEGRTKEEGIKLVIGLELLISESTEQEAAFASFMGFRFFESTLNLHFYLGAEL